MREKVQQPLLGRRVLVTRAKAQSRELYKRIRELGGEAYAFPTIRIAEPVSYDALDAALRRLSDFIWVVFTSVNGVDHFFRRLQVVPEADIRQLVQTSVAAIGPKTAEALAEKGLKADLMPGEYRAEALLAALEKHVAKGDNILLPRADIARKVLPDGLRDLGCNVTEVDAYRTEVETERAAEVAYMLADRAFDIITFTSASTVRNFVKALDKTGQPWRRWVGQAHIACIGPVAADAARELGLEPDVVASDYTIEGLLAAIQTLT